MSLQAEYSASKPRQSSAQGLSGDDHIVALAGLALPLHLSCRPNSCWRAVFSVSRVKAGVLGKGRCADDANDRVKFAGPARIAGW